MLCARIIYLHIFMICLYNIAFCQNNGPNNDNRFGDGNIRIGNSAGGFPIFQNPVSEKILYPIPSGDNKNTVEWVEMNDFLEGSIIVGVDSNEMPIFQLNNGDIAYINIKGKESTGLNIDNHILTTKNSNIKENPDENFKNLQDIQIKTTIDNYEVYEQQRKDHIESINITKGIQLSNTCYIPFGHSTCAPHFIISGAMKSGTTSLFSYLQNHPNVLPLVDNPRINGKPVIADKEIRFFNDPTFTNMIKNFGAKGALDNYLSVFPEIQPSSLMITGESSPMYICQPLTATRINLMLPYTKNIILLRNPIDRLYSEHWFKISLRPGAEVGTQAQYTLFRECSLREIAIYNYCDVKNLTYPISTLEKKQLDLCYSNAVRVLSRLPSTDPKCSGEFKGMCRPPSAQGKSCNDLGIKNSLYYFQLIEWVEQISEDRLLIIPSEQLYDYPTDTVQLVCEFLGLTELIDFDWSFIDGKAYNIVHGGLAQPGGSLEIGNTDTQSLKEKYPPMDVEFRLELEEFFSPFNKYLAKLLDKPNFWDY